MHVRGAGHGDERGGVLGTSNCVHNERGSRRCVAGDGYPQDHGFSTCCGRDVRLWLTRLFSEARPTWRRIDRASILCTMASRRKGAEVLGNRACRIIKGRPRRPGVRVPGGSFSVAGADGQRLGSVQSLVSRRALSSWGVSALSRCRCLLLCFFFQP